MNSINNKDLFNFLQLFNAILDGNVSLAIIEVKKLKKKAIEPKQIINKVFPEIVKELDKKCTVEYFNLLEIMLAGRAIIAIVNELYPKGIPISETKATVIIGSVEGDIHDLGKNIVKIMVLASGYRVIDCGKDCPIEELVDVAEQENSDAILVSGLISTVVFQIKKIRSILKQRKLTNIKVIVGGGALKQSNKDFLNVDYVAENVFDGIEYLDKAIKN